MTRLVLTALLISILFAGCGSKSKKNSSGKTVFRYNEASGISSLDPAFAKGQADIWACNQLFNGLVQMNDRLEVVPCIAKSWDISENGKVYTFHLRQDVFFHNDEVFGTKKTRTVTASDFAYSFNRILDPATASSGYWVFNNVAVDSLTGKFLFIAVDDSTFAITLKNPFPPFLGILTSPYCSVVPQEAIVKYGKDFRKHPVGTGPFRFSLWEERTQLIYHKNENYFEKENNVRLP